MDEPWIDPGGVGVAALARARGESGSALPLELVAAAREVELDEGELALGVALARELPAGVPRDGWVGLVGASRLAAANGSTRLELDPGALQPLLDDLGLGVVERALADRLLEEPERYSPVVSVPSAERHTPLILDDGSLYSQRTWQLECAVARDARTRLARDPLSLTSGAPNADASGDALPFELSDEQRRAVEIAASAPLALITGGPGTGKTSIVVAMLLRMAASVGRGGARIDLAEVALAAPTGKAADRLRLGVDRELTARGLPVPPAFTLHRLLGYSRRGGFRHHAGNPLSARVVIVDEASMVDLDMMNRLLDALRPESRLVMLGDADQLPSVDAGAVFRDLCAACESGFADHVQRLTRSYRMDPRDPPGREVLLCAAGINAGTEPPITWRESVDSLAFSGAEGVSSTLDAFLERWWTRVAPTGRLAFPRELDALDEQARTALDAVFARVERSRILTLTRTRRTGSIALNDALHARATSSDAFALGEPVLVLRNDYERGLFNGDQGVVLDIGRRRSVVFRRGDTFLAFPVEAVFGLVELAYAVTVHKAQGSEHDAVALVLPDAPIPLLSREILYTGITRARKSAVVVGTAELLMHGVARPLARSSGLRRRVELGLELELELG